MPRPAPASPASPACRGPHPSDDRHSRRNLFDGWAGRRWSSRGRNRIPGRDPQLIALPRFAQPAHRPPTRQPPPRTRGPGRRSRGTGPSTPPRARAGPRHPARASSAACRTATSITRSAADSRIIGPSWRPATSTTGTSGACRASAATIARRSVPITTAARRPPACARDQVVHRRPLEQPAHHPDHRGGRLRGQRRRRRVRVRGLGVVDVAHAGDGRDQVRAVRGPAGTRRARPPPRSGATPAARASAAAARASVSPGGPPGRTSATVRARSPRRSRSERTRRWLLYLPTPRSLRPDAPGTRGRRACRRRCPAAPARARPASPRPAAPPATQRAARPPAGRRPPRPRPAPAAPGPWPRRRRPSSRASRGGPRRR